MSSDKIEKRILLKAPRSRVWRAIADAKGFGTWFGMKLEGSFAPGARLRGQSTEPGYEHDCGDLTIERIEPERLFSYRWHPYTQAPNVGQLGEPTPRLEFRLEEMPGGTEL